MILCTLAIAGLLSYLNAKGRSENLNLFKAGPAPLAPTKLVSVGKLICSPKVPGGLVRVQGRVRSVIAARGVLELEGSSKSGAAVSLISVEWAGSMPIPGENVLVEGVVVTRQGRRSLRAEAVNLLPSRQ